MADSTRTTHRDDDDAPAARRVVRSSESIKDDVWDEAINDWVGTHLRNSAMSSVPSEAWNHLMSALPELRKILESKL